MAFGCHRHIYSYIQLKNLKKIYTDSVMGTGIADHEIRVNFRKNLHHIPVSETYLVRVNNKNADVTR